MIKKICIVKRPSIFFVNTRGLAVEGLFEKNLQLLDYFQGLCFSVSGKYQGNNNKVLEEWLVKKSGEYFFVEKDVFLASLKRACERRGMQTLYELVKEDFDKKSAEYIIISAEGTAEIKKIPLHKIWEGESDFFV